MGRPRIDKNLLEQQDRDNRILKEVRRLKLLLKNVDKDKIEATSSLLKNLAFYTIMLEDMRKSITYYGPLIPKLDGAGLKVNPEMSYYNTLVRNHTTLVIELTKLMGKNYNLGGDELDEFIQTK